MTIKPAKNTPYGQGQAEATAIIQQTISKGLSDQAIHLWAYATARGVTNKARSLFAQDADQRLFLHGIHSVLSQLDKSQSIHKTNRLFAASLSRFLTEDPAPKQKPSDTLADADISPLFGEGDFLTPHFVDATTISHRDFMQRLNGEAQEGATTLYDSVNSYRPHAHPINPNRQGYLICQELMRDMANSTYTTLAGNLYDDKISGLAAEKRHSNCMHIMAQANIRLAVYTLLHCRQKYESLARPAFIQGVQDYLAKESNHADPAITPFCRDVSNVLKQALRSTSHKNVKNFDIN